MQIFALLYKYVAVYFNKSDHNHFKLHFLVNIVRSSRKVSRLAEALLK